MEDQFVILWNPSIVDTLMKFYIERCPHFRNRSIVGHLGDLVKCPHYRGRFLYRKCIWDTAKCP